MTDTLERLITSLEFSGARALTNTLSDEELEEEILEMGFNTGSIVLYSFMLYLIQENETSSLHYIASVLLSHPLCHIEGAYQSAFYHAKRAIEIDENDVSLYEYLLFFNIIPDALLTNQEAKDIKFKINKLKDLE